MKLQEIKEFRLATREEIDLINECVTKPTKISKYSLLVCFWLFVIIALGILRIIVSQIVGTLMHNTPLDVGRIIAGLILILLAVLACALFGVSANSTKVVLEKLKAGKLMVLDTIYDSEAIDYGGVGSIVYVRTENYKINAGFKVRGSDEYNEESKFLLVKIIGSNRMASYELVLNTLNS